MMLGSALRERKRNPGIFSALANREAGRACKSHVNAVAEKLFLENATGSDVKLENRNSPRSSISLAFSRDGDLLASTHGDHTVKIVDVRTGRCLKSLEGHRRTPWVVQFHPERSWLVASGSLDHEVRVWDWRAGKALQFHDFQRPIASIAFLPGGTHLAVAAGRRLYIWDALSGKEPVTILKAPKSLRAVQFQPGGGGLMLTAEVIEPGHAMPPYSAPLAPLVAAPHLHHTPVAGPQLDPPLVGWGPDLMAMSPADLGPSPLAAALGREAWEGGWQVAAQAAAQAAARAGLQAQAAVPVVVGTPVRAAAAAPRAVPSVGSSPVARDSDPRASGSFPPGPLESAMAGSQGSVGGAGGAGAAMLQRFMEERRTGGAPSRRGPHPMGVLEEEGEGGLMGGLLFHDDPLPLPLPPATPTPSAPIGINRPPHQPLYMATGTSTGTTPTQSHPPSQPRALPVRPLGPGAGHGADNWAAAPPLGAGPVPRGIPIPVPGADPSSVGTLPPSIPRGWGGRARAASPLVAPLLSPPTMPIHVPAAAPHAPHAAAAAAATVALVGQAAAAIVGQEQPCTVKLKLWQIDLSNPTRALDLKNSRMSLYHVVLCSEMGAHMSTCGRYLAACVACRAPPGTALSSGAPSPYGTPTQTYHGHGQGHSYGHRQPAGGHHVRSAFGASPGAALPDLFHLGPGAAAAHHPHPHSNSHTAHYAAQSAAPSPLGYELRIYSLEAATFGHVLAARPVRGAQCLTSVQFSPTSGHILLAYGRRHLALLRSLSDPRGPGGAPQPVHTVLEVYRSSDLALVRELPSAEDEVNVAAFHPRPGGGLAYGTKEGRLRLLVADRTLPGGGRGGKEGGEDSDALPDTASAGSGLASGDDAF